MRNLRNFVMVIVAVVLMAGMVSEVVGDTTYTTANFVESIDSWYSGTNTYYALNFTFDGFPSEDVYMIGLSEFPDGEVYLNAAGYNYNSGSRFALKVYGDAVELSLLELYVIVDDGDGELFSINDITGQLNMGLGDDQVLSSSSVSIEGGAFGDISNLVYSPGKPVESFTSIAVETPPLVLISPGNGVVEMLPDVLLEWDGELGSTYDVYLGTDPNNLEQVSFDGTDEFFATSGLEWKTVYYWRVDAFSGSLYSSDVWSFETVDYKCQENLVGDLNGDCMVDFVDFAMFAENWMVEVPKVPDN